MKVGFFVTCLVDVMRPRIGFAALRLLRRAGVKDVAVPAAQTCCGQPAYNGGYRAAARKLAVKCAAEFAACERVVVPSGSCAAMFRIHYPRLFAADEKEYQAVAAFAAKCRELCEFLEELGYAPPPRDRPPSIPPASGGEAKASASVASATPPSIPPASGGEAKASALVASAKPPSIPPASGGEVKDSASARVGCAFSVPPACGGEVKGGRSAAGEAAARREDRFDSAVCAASPPAAQAAAGGGESKAAITYHDSCAGLRELGIKAAPRRLLAAAGVRLAEMQDAEECCGFGGTFAVKFGAISARMAAAKCRRIRAANAAAVAMGDLGCILNIEGRLRREGDSAVQVLHIAEVLDEAADESPPSRE